MWKVSDGGIPKGGVTFGPVATSLGTGAPCPVQLGEAAASSSAVELNLKSLSCWKIQTGGSVCAC